MNKTGILLINLGTPDDCNPEAVSRYLKEFLIDAHVVDLPYIVRWVLTRCLIMPFRKHTSAEAYQKIWTKQGSPLLIHTSQLKDALRSAIGEEYQVEIGMRYGNPSIANALSRLKNCETIKVIPLFPQYADASTGSIISELKKYKTFDFQVKNYFYHHIGFIQAYSEVIQNQLNQNKPDILLFSYHGLPERQVIKSGCKKQCTSSHCAPLCYRWQCYQTSTLLAEHLGLKPSEYTTAFQSRLGRTPWIKPYTDELISNLHQQGIRHIAVTCPSFVTDCLETLEEINIRLREQWFQLKGEEFTFIPCLNTHPEWVKALKQIATH